MRRWRLCAAVALMFAFAGAGAVAEAAPSARVRVRGPGAGSVERAVARVLASQGYRVVKSRRAALRVSGRVRGGEQGKRRVTVALTVRSGRAVVGRLRVRAASRRAALTRVERELWPAIAPALARRGAGEAGDVDDVDDAEESGEADEEADQVLTAAAIAPAAAPAAPAPRSRRASRADRATGRRARGRRTAAVEESSGSESSGRGRIAAGADVSASAPEEEGGAPWISIAVGPELYGRHFSYRDDVFEQLQEYDVTATPALTATGEVYPMVGSRGALAGLGAAGHFTHVPSFETEDGAGARYTSEARSFAGGARYRYMLGPVSLAAALDFGQQSFSIESRGDMAAPDFPAVEYRYLRAGLGAAAPLWSRYSVAAAVGYRHVLSSGEIESADFFPRATARALDVELEIAAALLWGFDVRLGAALERYGHDLQPEPGDSKVAGGALDQYPRLHLRLGYAY
jgi:hypothetical protein